MSATDDYQAYAVSQANQYGIPANMFLWQIGQESSWNPNAASSTSSAKGLGQFIDSTAASMGVNVSDPYSSINGAARYDAQLYAQTGNWQSALTSYGTLAGASSKTMTAFQNALGLGNTTTPNATGGTATSAGMVATSDSFIMKIAMIVLGIVLIGGAVFLFGFDKFAGARV